jgi:eukaryotic-like serine/threonine-protein kinase
MKRRDGADGAPVWSCAPGEELVGGVRAIERISVGPHCETWLVWSQPLWCRAVLKLSRPHRPEGCALISEAAALSGNLHPNLPRLYRAGTTGAVPYLLLEHVDGPTLDEELCASEPFSEPEVALLGAQLLTGLLAMHRRTIAHLDLRPDNVVLRDLRPVLIEFGAARAFGVARPPIRGGYAAPELAAGQPVAAAMDLYSLGAILHEARTGAPTFDPDLPATDRPVPECLGETPLAELIMALLRPDPAARPTTADALASLGRCLPDDLRPWPGWAIKPTMRPHDIVGA